MLTTWLDLAIQFAIAAAAVVALLMSVAAAIPAFIALSSASRANRIATGANVLSTQSNWIAAGSNAISAQANAISNDAFELSRRNESRLTESHDVEWSVGWVDAHHLFIQNSGLDTAYDVRYRIELVGGGLTGRGPAEVPPWTDFDFGYEVELSEASLTRSPVRLRIVWRSAAGSPQSVTLQPSGSDVFRLRRGVD